GIFVMPVSLRTDFDAVACRLAAKRSKDGPQLKKFPRPHGGDRARQGHRSPRHRTLVRRRGPDRPEEQDHAALGKAWDTAVSAQRSAYRLDLYLRRHLPERREGRSARPAALRYRGDEPALGRDRDRDRSRQTRRAP